MWLPANGNPGGDASRSVNDYPMNDNSQRSDHDLLIKLDVQLTQMYVTLQNFITTLEKKADKADVEALKHEIARLNVVVGKLETDNKLATARKQTIISVGEMGLKGWAALLTTISFILGLIKLLFAVK